LSLKYGCLIKAASDRYQEMYKMLKESIVRTLFQKLFLFLLAILTVAHFSAAFNLSAAAQRKFLKTKVKNNSRSYAPRYKTIAHQILSIEAETKNVTDDMYRLLDSLIDEAKAAIKLQPIPSDSEGAAVYVKSVFEQIDRLLLKHNFLYPKSNKDCWTLLLSDGLTPQNLDPAFLDELLRQASNTRRAPYVDRSVPFYLVDCDTASYLYMGIGEALKLPVSLVELPEHNFVRWSLGNNSYVNWETVYGVSLPDDNYMYMLGSPELAKDLVNRKIYLATMSVDDTIGYEYAARALKWEKLKDYKRAVEDYDRSIKLYSRSPFAYNNLAWLYSTIESVRNGKKAGELSLIANKIYPDNANYLDTLAAAYAENGEFDKAVATEQKAYELDPQTNYRNRKAAYAGGETYIDYIKKGNEPETPKGNCIVLQKPAEKITDNNKTPAN
jgi:tetratricopeptide (TPR) repeat protein